MVFISVFYNSGLVSKLEILFSDLHKIRALSADPGSPRCFLWPLFLLHCIHLHKNYSIKLYMFHKLQTKVMWMKIRTKKGNINVTLSQVFILSKFSHIYSGHDLMETGVAAPDDWSGPAQGRPSRIPIIRSVYFDNPPCLVTGPSVLPRVH